MSKKREIKFMPGCFDQFDGTQEELDALVLELTELAETATFDEFIKAGITLITDDDEVEEAIKSLGLDSLINRTLQ
jgi:hypothetical protein